MRTSIALVALAAALAGGSALAQTMGPNPPTSTIICLGSGGQLRPPVCHNQQASRLDQREDICICPALSDRVTVSICPKGVVAPPESAALETARKAAVRNGSLVGATYRGAPMCIAQRQPTGG